MQNITLFQFFHWYYSPEGNLWQHAREKAPHLASLGVTHVWLPPAFKSAQGQNDPGYAVYDIYDLGEFDQKGTVRTRYGTKDEYLDAIKAFHDNGIQVLADVVLNHMHGGDETEKVLVQQVDAENRTEKIGEPHDIDAHTKFTFPGRGDKYSSFKWDKNCFTGVDTSADSIFVILNEHTHGEWDEMLEDEKGNYDYLMGADIEFRNPYVREELKHWGEWYLKTTGVDGFRLDAVKHMPYTFYNEWLDHVRGVAGKDLFCVAEYWRNDPEALNHYIDVTEGRVQLFDVPLHMNFHEASEQGNDYDMRNILDNSLLGINPARSVTFVDNHDTQPLQSLQMPVQQWFQSHAYALILLREQGIPCVFYPALYDAKYVDYQEDKEIYIELHGVTCVEKMMRTRCHLAYGFQRDYFDHGNTIGWTREGVDEREHSGCAVVITNGSAGNKKMEVGKRHAGKTFIDICNPEAGKITIDDYGVAEFYVGDGAVAVWVREETLHFFTES